MFYILNYSSILGHYVIVPKKVPEFIVPDLTDFEVSFRIHLGWFE